MNQMHTFHVVLATAQKVREVDIRAHDAGLAAHLAAENWYAAEPGLNLITHAMARMIGDDHL